MPVAHVTVSMRVMSAGHGYRYLLKSVVVADGDRHLSTRLTDYYTAEGTPPGRWLGSGVSEIGDGWIATGDVVTEDHVRLLIGQGRDPATGKPLGRAFPDYQSRRERIRGRIEALDSSLPDDERTAAIAGIEVEESARKVRRAVAGFDYTFSVPKSVSVIWALGDTDTQEAVLSAHHAAVADVIDFMEREVAATRAGGASHDGAVAQVEVSGLIATAFDHYDSRARDPQLHTHVVISNKVKALFDGKWRSLDSRPMHAATVALSEHYNAVLADHLTRSLGIDWEQRDRGRDRNPAWEVTSVPQELIDAFSARTQSIEVEVARLIAEYVKDHGHQPSSATMIKLRERATLATRPNKRVLSLESLRADWRSRADAVLNGKPTSWLSQGTRGARSTIAADELPEGALDRLGRRVVEVVGEKRSTWRRWNLHAEATRQTMGLRFKSTADRETVVNKVVAAAEGVSVRLTPPDLGSSPPAFTRTDGTSVFRPRHSTVFTSAELLAAEDRLLKRAQSTTGPRMMKEIIRHIAHAVDDSRPDLSADQTNAMAAVGTSGRVIDVLVGPAGAGKTIAMYALRLAWETEHGQGSVVGLAPSAAAAHVLAEDLGIDTENTAKWLHDHDTRGLSLHQGQLVILDEASLAGTRTLDRITGHAAEVGAKVLLVGDWAQLAAVEAGGAFGMLVRDRDDPPALMAVRRFRSTWEAEASIGLRSGEPATIERYIEQDRIRDGDTDDMLDEVFKGWRDDIVAGRTSLMIGQSREVVARLNSKARMDRVTSGRVDASRAVRLHDGALASPGDIVVSRRNDRRLISGRSWVKNGDVWAVAGIQDDGSLRVTRTDGHSVVLPADYAARHVELGYAVTAHRAQGTTVDTTHSLIERTMTRETLYVAMTRGRDANIAYVATDSPASELHTAAQDRATGRSVLSDVLAHIGAERSAHDTLQTEQDRLSTFGQLAAEYETLAAAAQRDRWVNLLRSANLSQEQARAVIDSNAFGALSTALRRAEAHGHDPESLLPRLVAARPLGDAEDVAAVLHHRLRGADPSPRDVPRMIIGLIPEALGPMSSQMRVALDERKQQIGQRAAQLAEAAISKRDPWLLGLGPPPMTAHDRQMWFQSVMTVAAYRDRHQIVTRAPLGPPVASWREAEETARAVAALHRASSLTLMQRDRGRSPVHLSSHRGPAM